MIVVQVQIAVQVHVQVSGVLKQGTSLMATICLFCNSWCRHRPIANYQSDCRQAMWRVF